MASSDLTIDTPEGPMPTYCATPAGPVRGGLVVIQEAFGVTDHIRRVADRFAEAGWLAIAPALFHRQGSPVLGYGEFDQVRPIMGQLTAEGIRDDLDASFDHLEGEGFPAPRTAVVGYCMGGSVALVAGTMRPLGAAITYYGGGVVEGRFGFPPLLELAPRLQAPWLGQFGDLDKGIPVDQVEALRAAVATASVDTEVVRYADADHGFNCDDRPAVFNQAASTAGWERSLDWLDLHVQPA